MSGLVVGLPPSSEPARSEEKRQERLLAQVMGAGRWTSGRKDGKGGSNLDGCARRRSFGGSIASKENYQLNSGRNPRELSIGTSAKQRWWFGDCGHDGPASKQRRCVGRKEALREQSRSKGFTIPSLRGCGTGTPSEPEEGGLSELSFRRAPCCVFRERSGGEEGV